MKNNWKVMINQEGTLFIRNRDNLGELANLFGVNQMETGLCIYSHEMRSLRLMLKRLFPDSSIQSLDAIENLIREEFCLSRSIATLKSILEKENISYRSFSYAA